ncbi:single-stranded-DNA-specific exonuclease RecJ [Microbulbifer thermotolerans]|uniref:Single-stranded-DNA-specific exonuclease RecJ n=1 Tax=Microbulbifer thermotolerans TaxID=252514 RepID=A0A143HL54_MICTH|nr:single-stranded-DNA-specific exonuclease RecJ [Microbulbifer thermotolerans]AMX02241.1 single-stranded-DNA-specific exonuclease RecJ [Microbulbifer thermotolerans]MCX2778779.1 single-stranded-DNA-specific exonuclease RecJ [Microbulbifer thermotolerans]MCX2781949.1 single-stranded-DNA-specific exonuclease RecJ [Microbulbifer thermotolerans]MCX2793665.1 single-stranded-DNA-specific exonuclease RecJ [Microbulbifer thermotolerans]MCX2804084.1 single-stranded-DNA-specific exonuclease RecJ [Micro
MNTRIQRRPVDLSTGRFASDTPKILQRVLLGRGVTSEAELDHRLARLHPPQTMRGVDTAVRLIAEAIRAQEKILIVGDFDADGATSSTLAVLALGAMGAASVDFLVPNRFDYGYGLTPEIVMVAKEYEPALLITVDNGISSIDGVAAAKASGMKVVVTDHHLPGEQLPDADAIVNPNQPGCQFPSKNLAGVGVIFYLLSRLRTALVESGWFADQGISPPNMADYLDLVALGTVADLVPLDHNNRILVHQGIARIRAGRCRPGIAALLEVAGRDQRRLSTTDIGFILGPRINAAGRLDDIGTGIRCLLTRDPSEARELAAELDALNRDRKAIEQGMQREAMAALEKLQLEGEIPWSLCLYDENWHQGVVGILASRIKEKFHRPVIAFADGDNGLIKGSARSIPGLHIRDTLSDVDAAHPKLITKFGGHAMAAGLSLPAEKFPAFVDAFEAAVRNRLTEKQLQAVIDSDGELEPHEFTLQTAATLRACAPWGQAFPEPLFDGEFLLLQQRIVGERHLKMVLAPLQSPQQALDAIAFNVDTEQWPRPVDRVRVAYKLDINEFRGRESLQLLVTYLEAM